MTPASQMKLIGLANSEFFNGIGQEQPFKHAA